MKKIFFISALLFISGIFFGSSPIPKNSVIAFFAPLLFALPILWTMYTSWGKKEATILLLGLYASILTLETFALYTGLPYGHFMYADYLTPKLFSLTPLIIPFGFIPLFLGVIALYQKIPSKYHFFLLPSFLLVAADMVIDPGAVAVGLWTYEKGGLFYHVPLLNFVGWIIIGSILFTIWFKKIKKALPLSGIISLLFIINFWGGVVVSRGYAVPSLIATVYTISIFLLFYASYSRTRN